MILLGFISYKNFFLSLPRILYMNIMYFMMPIKNNLSHKKNNN